MGLSNDRLQRIVLADDQRVFRAGVARALRADAGLDVVGEATSIMDVLSIVRSAGPDVVLLGTQARSDSGLGNLTRLRECFPEVKVIVCPASDDLEHIEAAFRFGAVGCVLSTTDPAEIATAVRRVIEATEYRAHSAPTIKQVAVARALLELKVSKSN